MTKGAKAPAHKSQMVQKQTRGEGDSLQFMGDASSVEPMLHLPQPKVHIFV
jgi:hypothetical protein